MHTATLLRMLRGCCARCNPAVHAESATHAVSLLCMVYGFEPAMHAEGPLCTLQPCYTCWVGMSSGVCYPGREPALSMLCMVQESEAAGELSFAEFKRQRRAEEDDAEFPDEVH